MNPTLPPVRPLVRRSLLGEFNDVASLPSIQKAPNPQEQVSAVASSVLKQNPVSKSPELKNIR